MIPTASRCSALNNGFILRQVQVRSRMVPCSPGQRPRPVKCLQSGCRGCLSKGLSLCSPPESMEMLHSQPMNKQLLHLQVPAPCHGCWAWCGKQLCWKAPNLTFILTAAGTSPLCLRTSSVPQQGHVSTFHLQQHLL